MSELVKAPEALELASAAIELWTREDGIDEDEALDRLAFLLDEAANFEALLSFPFGAVLEAADGPAYKAGLRALRTLVDKLRPDPDRLRERAAKADALGRPHVAERRRRRAARLELRRER